MERKELFYDILIILINVVCAIISVVACALMILQHCKL